MSCQKKQCDFTPALSSNSKIATFAKTTNHDFMYDFFFITKAIVGVFYQQSFVLLLKNTQQRQSKINRFNPLSIF